MNWTPELRTFVAQHQDDDTDRLLLSANRYKDIDVREAVEQICARSQIRNKLPEWFANPDVVMGGRVPAEQCSSEQTARYKRSLVVGDTLCDLTGGMGVDFYYMSQGLKKAVYTERQAHLVECIAHNMEALYGAESQPEFVFRLGDGCELPLPDVDTLYLDPARRANDGSRVYDIAECEPNVVEWQDELRMHCRKLIVKLSPMADVSRTLQQLHGVTDLHVVATRNECKELLVEMMGCLGQTDDISNETQIDEVRIHCVDFRSNDTVSYDFDFGAEQKAAVQFVENDDSFQFFYEPDVTLLKAGAFKLLCSNFAVQKVDANSHYYVSNTWVEGFPGRCFEIDEMTRFSGKSLKKLAQTLPCANVSARNFPLSVDQIKNRSGIRDGGSAYLFATTFKQMGAVLLRCHKPLVLILLVFLMLPMTAFAIRRDKKKPAEVSITSLLDVATERSPFFWPQGRSFVYLEDRLSPMLQPETPLSVADTTGLYGSVWKFDAIVSEEDWMGRQKMQLRFVSPWGAKFRFGTEQVLTQQVDTLFHPVLGFLQSLDMVHKVDSVLRARTLFILINDDRIIGCDEQILQKFAPVRIDSITVGTELAPLRVWFSENDIHASFLTALPDSREKNTSTTIDRFLSISDPYLQHPNITKKVWQLIQNNQIQVGMTTEEVRLSIGRPLRFERFNAKSGAIERWYYANGRILEFWDGRFSRMGRE